MLVFLNNILDFLSPLKQTIIGAFCVISFYKWYKTLILQRNYNLSDEQCEFQIKDRLSFMDFLGIKLNDKVPDENTIWHFKEKPKQHNLSQNSVGIVGVFQRLCRVRFVFRG
ncbi:MAG: transposase [Gammaproteobacteria bacterium]|nr:transposase [Gammaproteobacteria bacterium]